MERNNVSVKGKSLIGSSRKTVLMVAFHYPPCQSAGTYRTEKFAQYLTEMGWDVIILTVRDSLYAQKEETLNSTSAHIHVETCYAFDSAEVFSFKGKYLGFACVPDRWWSWALPGISAGKKLLAKYKPDLIWSTYPIITAHYIAYRLHKLSGLPWIADFRDPLQARYDPNVQRYSWAGKYIEKLTIKNCTKAVFTTSKAQALYRALYPEEKQSKFIVVENGYDEDKFNGIAPLERSDNHIFQLLHSGDVYGVGRDPSDVFMALANLKRNKLIHSGNFRLVFRGITDFTKLESAISQAGIEDLVELLPVVSYRSSLSEMLAADALLLLQGPLFNNQVPSKLYDYVRANKPILAHTPLTSATASVLFKISVAKYADTIIALEQSISEFFEHKNCPNDTARFDYQDYSRFSKTVELAKVFDDILA